MTSLGIRKVTAAAATTKKQLNLAAGGSRSCHFLRMKAVTTMKSNGIERYPHSLVRSSTCLEHAPNYLGEKQQHWQHRSLSSFVPMAYRSRRERIPRKPFARGRGKDRDSSPPTNGISPKHESVAQLDSKQDENAQKRQRARLEKSFASQYKDFIRIFNAYQNSLMSDGRSTRDIHVLVGNEQFLSIHLAKDGEKLREVRKQIHSSLQGVHSNLKEERGSNESSTGSVIDFTRVEASEEHFRSLVMVTTDLVRTSSALYPLNPRVEYIDISRVALKQLHTLFCERKSLVERSLVLAETKSDNRKGLSGFLQGLASSFFKARTEGDFPESVQMIEEVAPQRYFAHEDASLISGLALHKAVIQNLHGLCASSGSYAITLDEITALLDCSPFQLELGSDSLDLILDLLKRVGTLESARYANNLFVEHYRSRYRNSFPSVIECYYNAARHEATDKQRGTVVMEMVDKVNENWSRNLSRSTFERARELLLAMKCFLLFEQSSSDKPIIKEVDSLIKRFMGRGEFYDFLADIKSERGVGLDRNRLRMLNLRARIYASCGHASQVSKMAMSLLRSGKKSRDAVIDYVDDELLRALLKCIQNRFDSDGTDSMDLRELLVLCRDIFQFILARGDLDRLPSKDTFDLFISTVATTGCPDDGSILEEIISMMEATRYLNGNDFDLSISSYHTILQCWNPVQCPRVTDAPGRSYKLLKRLELVSRPFLLDSRKIADGSVPKLYSLRLKPTINTYELVLGNCADSMKESDDNIDIATIAVEIGEELKETGHLKEYPKALSLLSRCHEKLPSDLPIKSRFIELLSTG